MENYKNNSDIQTENTISDSSDDTPFIVGEKGLDISNLSDDHHNTNKNDNTSSDNSSININTLNFTSIDELNLYNNYYTLADFENNNICIYNIFLSSNLLIFVDNNRICDNNSCFPILRKNLKYDNFPGCTFVAFEYSNHIKKYIHELNTIIANNEVKNIKIKNNNQYCNNIYFDEGEIKKNIVYKKMEVMNKFLFVPLNKYQIKQTEYKIRGFCQIAEELGAKDIEIKFHQSNSEKISKKLSINIGNQIDLFAGELGLVNNSSSTGEQSYTLSYPSINTITLNEKSIIKKIRKRKFIISEDMYNSNLELQYLVHSRCRHFITNYSTIFTLDSNLNIDETLQSKFKSYGLNLGTSLNLRKNTNSCIKILTNVNFSSKEDYYNNLGGHSVSLDKVGFKYLIESFNNDNNKFKTSGIFKIMTFIELYIDKVIKHESNSNYVFIKNILKELKKNLLLDEYAELLCNYFDCNSQWVHFLNFIDILSNNSPSFDKLGYLVIINDYRKSEDDKFLSILKFIQERCIYKNNINDIYKDLEKKYWEMLKPHRRDLIFLLKKKINKDYDFVNFFNWYSIDCLINNINKYTIVFDENDNIMFKELILNMKLGYSQIEFYDNILPFIGRYSQSLNYEYSNKFLLSKLLDESITYESFILAKITNLENLKEFIIIKTNRIKIIFDIIDDFFENYNNNLYNDIYKYFLDFIDDDFNKKYKYFSKKINLVLPNLNDNILREYIDFEKYNYLLDARDNTNKRKNSDHDNFINNNENKEIIFTFFKKILLYNEKLNTDNVPLNNFGFNLINKKFTNGMKKYEFHNTVLPFIYKLYKSIINTHIDSNCDNYAKLLYMEPYNIIHLEDFYNNINNFYDLVKKITDKIESLSNIHLNNNIINNICFN
jgi:hypothetical protein